MCGKNQDVGCGTQTNINLNSLGESLKIDVTSIPVGASCTYRVLSKCGFPALDISTTAVDVSVINFSGGDSTKVEDQPDSADLSTKIAAPKPKSGKISYVSGNPTTSDPTCGKMRKMLVTITNDRTNILVISFAYKILLKLKVHKTFM